MPADKIIPVHGTIKQVACEACGADYDFDQFCQEVRTSIKDIYQTDPSAPASSTNINCPKCGMAQLKPTTVLFGSGLPERFFACREGDLTNADLLIVAGTSLVVSPANSVAYGVPNTTPRLVVNREPVGQELGLRYGAYATRDVFYEGDCDAGFLTLAELLGWRAELDALADRLPDASRALLAATAAGAPGAGGGANTKRQRLEVPQVPEA